MFALIKEFTHLQPESTPPQTGIMCHSNQQSSFKRIRIFSKNENIKKTNRCFKAFSSANQWQKCRSIHNRNKLTIISIDLLYLRFPFYSSSIFHLLCHHNIKAGNWYKIFLFLIKLVICCAYVRHLVDRSREKRDFIKERNLEGLRMDVEHLCIACELTQIIAEGTFTQEGCEEKLLSLSFFVREKTKPEFHPKSSKTLPKWVRNKGTTSPPWGDVQSSLASLNATVAFLEMLQDRYKWALFVQPNCELNDAVSIELSVEKRKPICDTQITGRICTLTDKKRPFVCSGNQCGYLTELGGLCNGH